MLITHKNFKNESDLQKFNYLSSIIDLLTKEKFLTDHLTYNGNTKYMGFCKFMNNPNRRIDIRFVPLISYPSSLLYFTGSGEFNKSMRTYAIKNGYTLNEYGLYKLKPDKTKGLKLKADTEKDIFKLLKLDYVEPKNRVPHYKFD